MTTIVDIDQVFQDAVAITEEYLSTGTVKNEPITSAERKRRNNIRRQVCPLFVEYLSEDTPSYEAGKAILRNSLQDYIEVVNKDNITPQAIKVFLDEYVREHNQEFKEWCQVFDVVDDHKFAIPSEIQKHLKKYLVGFIQDTEVPVPALFNNSLSRDRDIENDHNFRIKAREIGLMMLNMGSDQTIEQDVENARLAVSDARQYREVLAHTQDRAPERARSRAP